MKTEIKKERIEQTQKADEAELGTGRQKHSDREEEKPR